MQVTPISPPPPNLLFVGPGDYKIIGQRLFKVLTAVGGLQPHHRVLDVGCGIGRMAVPLTGYLSDRGTYEGLDIVDLGIDWCRREITTRFPSFRFHHADVFNRGYNPQGRYDAGSYRFPFPDDEFDFVFLTSVFTHMVPLDLENYLAEVARVLKVGGRCLITFFLHNEESARRQQEGTSHLNFLYAREGFRTTNPRAPEDATCYGEAVIRDLYGRNGLSIEEPIHYGYWTGRAEAECVTHQDVIVAVKARAGCSAHPRVPFRRRAAMVVRRLFHRPLQKYVWRSETIKHVERARKKAG